MSANLSANLYLYWELNFKTASFHADIRVEPPEVIACLLYGWGKGGWVQKDFDLKFNSRYRYKFADKLADIAINILLRL